MFHPQFYVLRLQTIFQELHKTRPQSVKLESSQSETDRLRNNSGKGCHQRDTLYFSSLSHNPENFVETIEPSTKWPKRLNLSGYLKNGDLRRHYLKTDTTKNKHV